MPVRSPYYPLPPYGIQGAVPGQLQQQQQQQKPMQQRFPNAGAPMVVNPNMSGPRGGVSPRGKYIFRLVRYCSQISYLSYEFIL